MVAILVFTSASMLAFLVLFGPHSLAEQALPVDVGALDETELAVKGLGVLAFTFVAMAGALVVAMHVGELGGIPRVLAR